MKEILIEIDQNGNATIEAKGYDGKECKLETAEIEAALGKVDRVVEKPEMRRSKPAMKKASA